MSRLPVVPQLQRGDVRADVLPASGGHHLLLHPDVGGAVGQPVHWRGHAEPAGERQQQTTGESGQQHVRIAESAGKKTAAVANGEDMARRGEGSRVG